MAGARREPALEPDTRQLLRRLDEACPRTVHLLVLVPWPCEEEQVVVATGDRAVAVEFDTVATDAVEGEATSAQVRGTGSRTGDDGIDPR